VIIDPAAPLERFGAIDAALARHAELSPVSVLLEGALPPRWQPEAGQFARGAAAHRSVAVHNLGFGCPCCIGSLPLTVTLTRVLRQEKPELIILAPGPGAHVAAFGQFLLEKFAAHLRMAADAGGYPGLARGLL
jgi:hypothetical protein